MNQEEILLKELAALVRLGKNQGNRVSQAQVTEAFTQSVIAEDKLPFITEYLQSNNIRIDDDFDPEEVLSAEDKDFLSIFMEEIEALPKVNEDEKEAIILAAMEDDKEAQNKLLEIFLPKVVEIAKLYVGQDVLLEDLIGEGNVALVAAVSMASCIESPKEADGFIAGIIMDAMEVLVSEESEAKDIDEKILEKVNRVAMASEELYADLRKKVTPEELAQETDLTVEEIIEAFKLSGNQIDTLEIGEADA